MEKSKESTCFRRRRLLPLAFMLVLILMFLFGFRIKAYAAKTYYVNYYYLNVRSGPATTYKLMGKLSQGDKLSVKKITDGWAKITYKKKTAYVYSYYLSKTNPLKKTSVSTSASTSAVTTTDSANSTAGTSSGSTSSSYAKGYYVIDYISLNVRSGAGLKYSVINKVYNGSIYKVDKVSGIWGRITCDGSYGWISLECCSKTTAAKYKAWKASSSSSGSSSSSSTTSSSSTSSSTSSSSKKTGWYLENYIWRWYSNGSRKFSSDELYTAWTKIKNCSSGTGYYIVVDKANTQLYVFTGYASSWSPVKVFNCSIGKSTTPTPSGTYSINYKFTPLESKKSTEYYAMSFYGNYCIHSVLYKRDSYTIYDGRLNQAISDGCVRLALSDSKWLYNNIGEDTAVKIY